MGIHKEFADFRLLARLFPLISYSIIYYVAVVLARFESIFGKLTRSL
jgi:hypothetical protein